MASDSETGPSKNVGSFEKLIAYCTGYGEIYNPANDALKLPALNALFINANNAIQALKVAKSAYDNATNMREVAFKPLKKFSTRIVGALAATKALPQTVDDARTAIRKIQGTRAVPVKKMPSDADTLTAEAVNTASVSRQSYDQMTDHFAQLIQTLASTPEYAPNENELKVETLNALLADLKAKNTAVAGAIANLSTTRIARNKVLNADNTGLCDVAQDVKNYVKSIFGASSPEYKEINKLRFRKKKDD